MKTIRIPLFLGALMVLCVPHATKAQEMNSSNAPTVDQAPPPPPPGPRGPMGNLSDQERAQLKAAHDKAIAQNPALEQAMKDARQAVEKARKDLHDAMIAVDSSVAPILSKIEPPKKAGHCRWGECPGKSDASQENRRHGPPPGLANLSEQEREQLKAAHEKVKNDPSVVSAREALKTAATPEARRAAHEALRQAADAALLKADPSLGPILEKLHQVAPPSVPSSSASPQESMVNSPQ